MSCRVVTIAREFGSGGAAVAHIIAGRLGWTLVDACLIEQVAHEARVAETVAAACDERVDSWVHRFSKGTVVAAVLATGVPAGESDVFDSETMAKFSRELIRKAYATGNCVIVGRGGQCILRGCADVRHVFVYGSTEHKLERLKQRFPGRSRLAELMQSKDADRRSYLAQYYGQLWDDRRLYHMMLCSDLGDEVAAGIIIESLGLSA